MREKSVTGIVRFTPIFVCFLLGAPGCRDPVPEPEPERAHQSRTEISLTYEFPAGFSLSESSKSGVRRAGYKVPKVGNDKEDAELLVLFYGTGAAGDRDKRWDEWFEQFDGDAKRDATRDAFTVGDIAVETFEFKGNYKLNMGPKKPGMTKSPVQMVKNDFRMIGAVVKTPDRGNWFFRLVGPDETVLANKEAFLAALRAVK